MEESIWMVMGVIAVLIGFGILMNFIDIYGSEDKVQYAEQSIFKMTDMCRKVCRMPDETKLAASAFIPSGSLLEAQNSSICISIQDSFFCGDCECNINPYTLDLTGEDAIRMFKIHEYQCFFLNKMSKITLECKG